jgi:hypothetical protein
MKIIDYESVGDEVTDMALKTHHPHHTEKVLSDQSSPYGPKF